MTSQKPQSIGSQSESGFSSGNASESLIDDSFASFNTALKKLDAAVDTQIERSQSITNANEEVQRLASSRAKLAKSLDDAETRTKRLAETNGEVSRRLVGAMELVRTVLDRQDKGTE